MPIDVSKLATNDLVVVTADTPIGSILPQLPGERARRAFAFVVFPAAAGGFHVLQWLQVERIARGASSPLYDTPIGQLPLPAPVPAVDESANMQDTLELRDEQRPLRVVVVLRNGQVLGLLVRALRDDTQVGEDPFPPIPMAAPFEDAGPDLVLTPEQGVEPAPPPPPPVSKPAVEPVDDRVINAWIDDDEVQAGMPLQVGESYELKFSVERPRANALAQAIFDSTRVFSDPTVKQVDMIVVLDSDDVEIIGEDQSVIVVPRTGKSRKNATFTISPKKDGRCEIRAMFFANNRVFQKMKITVQVGAPAPETPVVATESSGKTVGSALLSGPRPQEIDLVILKKDAGYEFILNSGGFKRATVNLSEAQIADLTATARDELKKVVYVRDNGRFVYQSADTNVPEAVHAETLKTLMGVGVELFEALFFSPGSGADANEMGRVLRQKSQAAKLHIGIIAERFTFPWALLYDRDYDIDAVDPEGFWGFKHVIEYTPEFRAATTVNFSPEISVDDTLELGFVVNTTIDDELRRKGAQVDVIKPQQVFLQNLAGVKVTEYPTRADLVRLLRDASGTTQLIYFYCHAESALPGASGGVDASRVLLSDGAVSLKDLKRSAPLSKTEENLQSCPLVFLNACESAELSPYLYDGLVPYLIAKGARGVVGTEVNTPALFAAEFAKVFLERFVAGDQPLGELLLQMRRKYLTEKHNVMGLVYALHSGADVVVRRT